MSATVSELVEPVPPAPPEDAPEPVGRDWRHPTINTVILLLMLVVGLRIGLQSLGDNSFMTHLATGRIIWSTQSVPHVDPYSWTAAGTPWTVQSWGASVVYGGLDKAVGLAGIRVLDAVLVTVLILTLWHLIRPADSVVTKLFVGGLIVSMGTGLWVERPLLFGAVFLAITLVAADGDIDPRWLVPVMWLWVNTHGSFPFGVLVLVLLAAGRWLDERRTPLVELRALGWATLGTLLGAINPVGAKILWFPVSMLSRKEAFDRVAEWEPPHWHRGVEKFFALQIILALVLIIWRNRRWRAALPLIVFGIAAVTSTRNILQASIVIAPILAVGLTGLGSIDGTRRPLLLRPVAVALCLLGSLVAVFALAGPNTDLSMYPVKPVTWMEANGLLGPGERPVHQDYVGNYLEFRYGPERAPVFIDDRVDMYPLPVIRAYTVLISPDGGYQRVLDRYGATSVLWRRKTDFGKWLSRSDRWQVVHRDSTWLVAIPR